MASSESDNTAFEMRLLGPLQVRVQGQPLPHLRSRKPLWLLALLTLRQERPVERDWLAGTLWPESTQEQALANLRLNLRVLRQALGEQAYRLQAPTPRTLCLDLSHACVDLIAFDAAIARGDGVSLEQAISLYSGPLLEGCEEEWVFAERQQREQTYLNALERLAEQAHQSSKPGLAAEYLRRAIAIDPLRESLQRALMLTMATRGDYNAALSVYRELRMLLHQQMHTDPDATTQALFQKIRQQARLSAPTGSLPPAVPSVPSLPNNLPVQATSFIGREKEIESVKILLASSRLLTLTGAGGCGKTRLALQVASAVLEPYPDGVGWVELASLFDPALVIQAAATALGIREEPGKPLAQTLTDFLKPKQLLLLLDNCEHLLSACASLADSLISACPNLSILTTSRENLGITGEQVYRVPSLSSPDPKRLPAEEKDLPAILAEYEAVRLFVERARLQRPDFTLTSENAIAVALLCHHLDGIPLAIELAAARIRSLTAVQIAERLGDRFRLLKGGSRTAPRQQTLKATLDWSYELLNAQEQLLLGRLSVFAGGWTLEAAEKVCTSERLEAWEVLDVLSRLVDKSLVVFDESREGEGRYRLLETIRQYAQEHLIETKEVSQLRRQHLDYFLALAEAANPQLDGKEQQAWLQRLDTERDNLRTALVLQL